jgi:hypothetical protein
MKKRIPLLVILVIFYTTLIFPDFLIPGIMLFIISLVFAYAFNITIFEKIAITVLPIILWIPAKNIYHTLQNNYKYHYAQKIDFIFQEGFKGDAVIITEKKCGQTKIVKDGFEKLYIPKNGVLFYNGEIKNYESDYNFRYFKIVKNDTLQIPDSHVKGFINKEKSISKVMYVDGTTTENQYLSKIQLYLFNDGENRNYYNRNLLLKEFECE